MPEQLQLGAGWDVLGSAVVQRFLSFFFYTFTLYWGNFLPNEIPFACGNLTVCHSGLGCPSQLA